MEEPDTLEAAIPLGIRGLFTDDGVMRMDCVFCRIVAGDLPSDRVFESDSVIAFRDLDPKAPVHLLVIPKQHVNSLDALDETDPELAHALLQACRTVADEEGLAERGYRVVTNVGDEGGQSVGHLHFHVLGGRAMGWPPG